jgi:hypothetical protein
MDEWKLFFSPSDYSSESHFFHTNKPGVNNDGMNNIDIFILHSALTALLIFGQVKRRIYQSCSQTTSSPCRIATDPVFSDRIPIPRSRAKADRIPHSVPLVHFRLLI